MKKALVLVIAAGVLSYSAQAALVNHWAMNEGSGYSVTDSGTGASTGVFQQGGNAAVNPGEGPQWVTDPLRGTALKFDGNDYVLTDSQGVLGAAPRTVTAWFYLSSDQNRHTLVEWGVNTVSAQYFRLLVENKRLRFEVSGGNALALNAGDLSENRWYHVALVVGDFNNDGQVRTPEVKFYLDGQLTPQTASLNQVINTVFGGDDWVRLGGGQTWQTEAAPRNPLNGMLDDVRIYDTALTAEEIVSLVNIRAFNPAPANNAVLQGTALGNQVEVAFSWNTGVDPDNESVPNPEITGHYFYIREGDPNFVGAVPQEIAAGDPTQAVGANTLMLNFDKVYYWRVDESVNGSEPSDPNTITGPVWMFESLASIPMIDVQPQHASAFSSESASFTVSVTSITPASYTWYRSADNAVNTPDDDASVGFDSNVLTISPATGADEGYYYCIVANEGGSAASEPAYLTIKRQVLNWGLDNSFQDSSGEGNHGVADTDPNWAPPTFVTDVAGAVGSHSASFDGINQRIQALLETGQKFHAGYTLTLWAKGTVESQDVNSGLFNNNVFGSGFQIDIGGGNQYQYRSSVDRLIGPAVMEWVHLAVVCDGTDTTIYYNLENEARIVLAGVADLDFIRFQLGCNRGESNAFAGLLDNLQIWNYARRFAELASSGDDTADYVDVTGEPVCEVYPAMDFDRDCKVGLQDFAVFVNEWLECGLVPNHLCD